MEEKVSTTNTMPNLPPCTLIKIFTHLIFASYPLLGLAFLKAEIRLHPNDAKQLQIELEYTTNQTSINIFLFFLPTLLLILVRPEQHAWPY